MAIPRVDISQEIADWQAAVYGEEVRSANVSALTKLQTQMNAACDGIETAQTDVATAVNTANAASATANQASSDAQDAIDDAQAAITTAQGYAANAEGSAQAAAASATAAQTAQTNAQTAQLAAEAAEQAAEDAAQQAQIAINITPDEETIHHASDAVGTISAITYTLEEIAAMTDPSGKIPDASAVASLRESLSNSVTPVKLTVGGEGHFSSLNVMAFKILPNTILICGYVMHTSAVGTGTSICKIPGYTARTDVTSSATVFAQCDDNVAKHFVTITNSGNDIILFSNGAQIPANTALRLLGLIQID